MVAFFIVPYDVWAAFDKDKPAASTILRTSNPQILANWAALESAIGQDHEFSTGGTNSGKHLQVTFDDPLASAPATVAASEGVLYTLDVSSKAELHFEDEDENTIQITSAGKILSASLDMKDEDDMASDSATHAASQQSIKAYADSVGTAAQGACITKNGATALTANWDGGSYEIRALTFESDVTTGTAPFTIASTTKCTNLNADKVDGYDISAYSAGESYTFPGGFIMKMGEASKTSGGTKAFDVAFPNNIVSVVATVKSTTTSHTCQVSSVTTSGFKIYHNAGGSADIMWIAIGN